MNQRIAKKKLKYTKNKDKYWLLKTTNWITTNNYQQKLSKSKEYEHQLAVVQVTSLIFNKLNPAE